MQGKILPAYLPTCRWFRSKARTIQRVEVRRVVPVSDDPHASRLLWLDVSYTEGLPETYALPLQILPAEAVKARRSAAPTSCIASVVRRRRVVRRERGRRVPARPPRRWSAGRQVRPRRHARRAGRRPAPGGERRLSSASGDDVTCRALGVEQSNTSIVYKNEFFLKLYRKVEEGENPDIELTRFLTEKAGFANVPPYAGQIEFRPADRKKPTEVLALMQNWVASEGDAWTLTIDAASRFFERVLAARHTPGEAAPVDLGEALGKRHPEPPRRNVQEIIGGIYRAGPNCSASAPASCTSRFPARRPARCPACPPNRSTCSTSARWSNPSAP